jgi:dipeptidyl aminopeptidase/acylaminoacyl peptidase
MEKNRFNLPDLTSDQLNIPWFVSQGYIVFLPDMNGALDKVGELCYNSVMGGANYLIKFKWVDSTKLGLFGHSFGGFKTNYIVTHTSRFKAAVSGAGASSIISSYLSLNLITGVSKQDYYQFAMSGTLWDEYEKYLLNDPIRLTGNVQTPILLVNNKQDAAVNYTQGVDFFCALRRLGKPSWLLQYEGAAHSLSDFEQTKDYTTRLLQFYNYYLKDDRAPKWLVKGIPATLKGIDDGFELMPYGVTPSAGLLKK